MTDHDYARCIDRLDRLITTFRDDFAKYRRRSPVARLADVFESVSLQAGSKFKYSAASNDCGGREMKAAREMIRYAGLADRVRHRVGQGIPLGAQVKPKRFKILPFDIGIHQRVLGMDIPQHLTASPTELAHRGSLAEVFVGLELIASGNPARQPQLYYWHREAASSSAEVDYLIQRNTGVVPLESKAGRRGQMQSMYQFLDLHAQSSHGIRLSVENFSCHARVQVMPLYNAAKF